MSENYGENIAKETVLQKEVAGFANVVDFVEREYFISFLNKLDEIEDKSVFVEIKNELGIDIEEMRKFIDQKIPVLLEKIRIITQSGETQVIVGNSFRDVLGNSVTAIFRTIVKTAKNFNDPKVQERIKDPDSDSRKILALFSREVAEYYVDNLCNDDEKLKSELNSTEGFLGEYKEYFNIFPSGSVKAIYFRFFSELKNGNINEDNIENELNKLDDRMVNKEKIKLMFKK